MRTTAMVLGREIVILGIGSAFYASVSFACREWAARSKDSRDLVIAVDYANGSDALGKHQADSFRGARIHGHCSYFGIAQVQNTHKHPLGSRSGADHIMIPALCSA